MRWTSLLALFAAPALAREAPKAHPVKDAVNSGTDWAVLIAGSNGWGNYRHQSDIYHSYQILKANGVDPNQIITLQYDDIANSSENPHPGTIINNPTGTDVYAGFVSDYTGNDVSAKNFLSVLAGDSAAMQGIGSGKVLQATAEDRVFVYFADHGGPGILGMPLGQPYLYAKDLNDALTARADAGGFLELTFYVEACESGSIFEGILPEDKNIYVVTAANADESSWGYYCPGMTPAPPAEYNTCLGDLFSIAWLEDSDASDLHTETLEEQYLTVKDRTSQHGTYHMGSHVMQYGTTSISNETCDEFMGGAQGVVAEPHNGAPHTTVSQRDADLHHLYTKYHRAEEGPAKETARAALSAALSSRENVDSSVKNMVSTLLGKYANVIDTLIPAETDKVMTQAPPAGQPVVNDWDCFKASIAAFEKECTPLTEYGMKHARALANLCNKGFTAENVASACQASKTASVFDETLLLRPVV